MNNLVNNHNKKRIIRDLLLIVIFNGIMLVIFTRIDMLEWLGDLSRHHEAWELDEIVPLSLTLALSLGVFSLLRWREGRAMHLQLQRMAIQDELTGLYNRHYGVTQLKTEIERSHRYQNELSILLLDIDHFKDVNDNWGHQIGDVTLVGLARLLTTFTRQVDIVSRWGGEEFLIICPNTGIDGAATMAEELCRIVRGHEFQTISKLTVSIGVTEMKSGDNDNTLLTRADVALYNAKHNGRDQCQKI